MEAVDPATGRALPADAIQRILFIANKLHVYNIPPLTSMRGHNASTWTTDASRHIFTARLRMLETSHDADLPSSSSTTTASGQQKLKVDVVLEDPSTGQLFAACPYTDRAAVEPAVDSSRFFALTVRDDAGRKAVLGIGFEERPEAFDFAVALQEARKSLGWEGQPSIPGSAASGKEDGKANEPAKDYSLKEGETITVNLGSKFGRRRPQQEQQQQQQDSQPASLQSFALAPPPSSAGGGSQDGGGFALAPPPSASDVKRKRRSLMEMGFDDGQNGEFA
ncbi:hypothetical protein K4F52_001763 [Lecanicillium sp. MT-2017a]|nr:hypothetical protein K4F52_001763 [Lecanicillium sp. MT-2017a]